jgi:hypothetical protein
MRRRVLIDVETSAWYCASGIPELVVLGYSFENEPEPTLVTDRGAAVALWQSWVTDPNCDIIAHNSPFDCSVMAQSSDPSAEPGTGWAYAQVFAAYEAGRIYCTEVRQRLCEMYDSRPDDRGYGLAAICARVFGLDIGADKKAPPEALAFLACGISSDQWPGEIRWVTPWRYRYGELRGVPLDAWPAEARRYAADDVTLEWRLFHEQEKYRAEQLHYMGLDPLADQHIEARAAWDLHILRTPGFTIDVERVRRLVDLYYRIERTCAEILATHCAWCGSELAPVPAECSRCGGRDTLIQRKVIHRGKPGERTDEHGSQTLTRRLVWETLGRGGSELTDGAKARGEPLGERSVKCDGKAMMRCVAAKNGRHVTTDGGAHAFQADGALGLVAYLRSLDPPDGGCLVINARRLFNKAQKTRTSFLDHMTSDKAMAQVAAALGITVAEAEHRYLVDDWRVRTSYQVLVSTGRTACVAAWTPVLTPRGEIPMVDIRVGDQVWTHQNRWREVTATWIKPVSPMFDIVLSNGEVLTCTGSHKLLTSNGWLTTEQVCEHFQTVDRRCEQQGQNASPVSVAGVSNTGSDCEGVRHLTRDYIACFASLHAGSGAQGVGEAALFSVQNGGQKPHEGQMWGSSPQLGRFVRGWQGLSDLYAQGETSACASYCDGTGARIDGAARGIRGPSYRWEHQVKRAGQSSASDANRSQDYPFLAGPGLSEHRIEAIYHRGDFQVYDITVDDDESYSACGVFSHNSRNWNVQNVPARTVKDESIGVRGCVIPPPGWVIIDSDYGQLELCHYAQVLTDMRRESSGDPTYVSSLAQAINEGKDGHVIVAAQLVGISYEAGAELHAQGDKEFAPMRQLSKVANYGFSGGMGAATFVEFAAAQGLTVQRVMAQKARDAFMASWHESPEYFAAMGAMCGADAYGEARVQILRTGLIRGRVPFCAACNIQFQGPAARGCKQALRALIHACYQEPDSPLFGSRPLAFVHDEFVTISPIDRAPAALAEQDRIMVAEMSRYLPDVKIAAEGKILQRWGK